MNDEEAFQDHLDQYPDDHFARMAFADWLQDRGDVRAEGYRALGDKKLYPDMRGGITPTWFNYRTSFLRKNSLPKKWLILLTGYVLTHRTGKVTYWVDYHTRRQAEDAAALAYVEYAKELTGAKV